MLHVFVGMQCMGELALSKVKITETTSTVHCMPTHRIKTDVNLKMSLLEFSNNNDTLRGAWHPSLSKQGIYFGTIPYH